MTNLDSILKSRDIALSTKVCLVKAMVFPLVMYGCESWTIKKASAEELMLFNCGIGEDSWESLGLQGDTTSPSWRRWVLGVHWKDCCWSWNSNTLTTWCKELTHWKDPDTGKDWGEEEKGTTEDETAGWHHWLNGHGFGWTLGVGDGQGVLVCCSSWGCRELDMTEWLNWTVRGRGNFKKWSRFGNIAEIRFHKMLKEQKMNKSFHCRSLYTVKYYSNMMSMK